MHGKQASIFLISIQITCLQTNPLVNLLVSENNYFHKLNVELHILTNKLFSSLDLSQEFVRNDEIQSLLITHSDLNRLAERHSSVCDDIKNITSSKFKNTTKLEKLFGEIINEEIDQLRNYNNSFGNVITHSNVTLHQGFQFANELFVKISELTIKDLATVTNDTQINLNARKFGTPLKSREIKAWRPSESVEDEADNETRRIYKGKKTRIRKYPFLVSIHVMNEFICAGSIISKELVITAASCLQIAHNNSLDRDIRRTIFVRVGSDYPKRHGELIPIIQIYFHPDYNTVSLNNNIAIIRMMKRLKYSRRRKIERIQYDRDGDFADNVNSVSILGWGAKDSNHGPNPNSKVSIAHLDLYNTDDCSEIYSRYYVTENNFCAGFVTKSGGACNKDVGGPAIVSDELVGIISFGPIVCGKADAPTVFAKISSYATWIDNVIGQQPEMRHPRKLKIPENPSEDFLTPILTTSKHFNSVTDANVPSIGTTEDVYPDEMIILKEILQQIVLSNNSIMDYILYGDLNADENTKIETTTAKQIHKVKVNPHLFINKNMFQQNYNKEKPRKKKPLRMFDDIIDSSTSYEDIDTEIKILESLVGFYSDDKPTTAKYKTDFKFNNKHRIPRKVINQVKYHTNEILSDSSDYYEDEGLSIEENKKINEKILRSTQDYDQKATTNTHRINLEDYKNIMIYINPMKESRGVITIDNKELNQNITKFNQNEKGDTDITDRITTTKSTTKTKRNQLGDDKDPILKIIHFKENRQVNIPNENDKHTRNLPNNKKYVKDDTNIEVITEKQQKKPIDTDNYIRNYETNKNSNTKPVRQSSVDKTSEKNIVDENRPIGKAMAISDEDFEYYDNKEKKEYTSNLRSRNEDTSESVFWLFRSND